MTSGHPIPPQIRTTAVRSLEQLIAVLPERDERRAVEEFKALIVFVPDDASNVQLDWLLAECLTVLDWYRESELDPSAILSLFQELVTAKVTRTRLDYEAKRERQALAVADSYAHTHTKDCAGR